MSHLGAHWEAVRQSDDRRRVVYWRYTTGPDRKQALAAVSRKPEGFRALLYDWEKGNPATTELGFYRSKTAAMRAVEKAMEAR